MPRHRFMSAYEQRIEPPDRRWQYLLMAAEPYETIAFKVSLGIHSLPIGEVTGFSKISIPSERPYRLEAILAFGGFVEWKVGMKRCDWKS